MKISVRLVLFLFISFQCILCMEEQPEYIGYHRLPVATKKKNHQLNYPFSFNVQLMDEGITVFGLFQGMWHHALAESLSEQIQALVQDEINSTDFLQNNITQVLPSICDKIKQCAKKAHKGRGAIGTICLMTNDSYHFIYIGKSMAYIMSHNDAHLCGLDHVPNPMTNLSEYSRIQANKGMVVKMEINTTDRGNKLLGAHGTCYIQNKVMEEASFSHPQEGGAGKQAKSTIFVISNPKQKNNKKFNILLKRFAQQDQQICCPYSRMWGKTEYYKIGVTQDAEYGGCQKSWGMILIANDNFWKVMSPIPVRDWVDGFIESGEPSSEICKKLCGIARAQGELGEIVVMLAINNEKPTQDRIDWTLWTTPTRD